MLLTLGCTNWGSNLGKTKGLFSLQNVKTGSRTRIQCLPGLFPGGLSGRSVKFTSIWGSSFTFMACRGKTFIFTFDATEF
jgi:hypothetical protein